MFLNPLGLLALLAVPAVLGLHLFRRRFRRHVVSAVFLWEAQDRAPVAGRKREPLRTSASFWCEILAALLLALAFAGLRLFGAGQAQHLVVVLDASASMGAVGPEGALAARAREIVRERIEALPRGSRVTLVASGSRPALLAGPAAFAREAAAALKRYAPSLSRHDLGPAVALGQQLAGEGRVLLVGDRFEPERWPEEVELVAIGEPIENLAITHATRTRERDAESGAPMERVHVALSSFAFAPRRVTVAVSAGGEVLAEREVEIEPGERKHLAFELPAGAPVVRVRIPEDALAIDDVAWLAPEPPRTLALASTLPPELSRHLGLSRGGEAGSNIDRWLDLVPDSVDAASPEAAHLVISQGLRPGTAWCLSFEHTGGERRHLIGPFLIDKRHELLDGVTLEGIVWTVSEGLELSGAPLVSAGNLPILTEGFEGDRRVYKLNLDPTQSSLQRSPDWPILLANLAELRRRELPGPARTSLAIGETFVWRDRRAGTYRFEGTGEGRELRALDTLAVEDVAWPGLFVLSRQGEDGATQELCEVAYSFADPAESDLRDLAAGERASASALDAMQAGISWVEVLLLVAALALVLLDWWVLGRPRVAGQAAGGA